jgi:hypothetical protein
MPGTDQLRRRHVLLDHHAQDPALAIAQADGQGMVHLQEF